MIEFIYFIVTMLWGLMMYWVGVENGYAKYVNRDAKGKSKRGLK